MKLIAAILALFIVLVGFGSASNTVLNFRNGYSVPMGSDLGKVTLGEDTHEQWVIFKNSNIHSILDFHMHMDEEAKQRFYISEEDSVVNSTINGYNVQAITSMGDGRICTIYQILLDPQATLDIGYSAPVGSYDGTFIDNWVHEMIRDIVKR